MDLHANAVLTVRQRQRVCDLVATGVTITAAALVVGCSRQTASKWVNRRRRGESLARSLEPAAPLAQAHTRAARAGDPACTSRAARRAARDRLGARYRGLDRARRASPPRPLATRPARAREAIVRYERASPGRARARRLKKLGRIMQARPPRHRRPLEAGEGQGRLAVPVRRDRRPLPARLRLRLPRRDGRQRDRLPGRARPLLRLARHRGRARAHRQRHLLQAPLGRGLRSPRDRRQEDTRLPPPDQRQGRALHPHPARALGVRLSLRSTSPSVWPHYLQHSTSTIASVPTALSEASRRCSASTTSLGHTSSPRAPDPWLCV